MSEDYCHINVNKSKCYVHVSSVYSVSTLLGGVQDIKQL